MSNSCPKVDIGGQAVLEGVMMKAPDHIAVAVRRENGDVIVKREAYTAPSKNHKWMGLPFIRGSVNMVQMLSMGMQTLTDAADMLGVESEEPSKFEKWLAAKLGKSVDKIVMAVAAVLAVCLSLGLFVLLPNLIIKLFPAAATGGMLLLKNLASGIVYLFNGKAMYSILLPAALCSILGGWLGSRFAIKGGSKRIKQVMFVVLGLLFAKMIYDYFV